MLTTERWKFGRSSEQPNGTQISLIEETIDADIAAIDEEINAMHLLSRPNLNPAKSLSGPHCLQA